MKKDIIIQVAELYSTVARFISAVSDRTVTPKKATKAIMDSLFATQKQTQQDTLEWCLREVVGEDVPLIGLESHKEEDEFLTFRNEIKEIQRQIIKNKMEEKMTLKNNKQGGEK